MVLLTNGGEACGPKYTSYEVAPAEAPQVRAGESKTPIAPFAGVTSSGGPTWVVNDQVAEAPEPPAFLATTCQ